MQLIQLNETLNNFVIGSNTNVGATENETIEYQTDGRNNNREGIIDGEISACQSQVIGKNVDDKFIKVVDSAVQTVKNCMQDAILTAMAM